MTHYVVSSGTTSGLTLYSGDTMRVFNSGTAKDITVTAGGTMSAYAGGVTRAASINGGIENVSAGGRSYYTACRSGGVELVSGGVSYNTAIGLGSLETVYRGAAMDTTVKAGGHFSLSGGTASGTVIAAGGTFELFGGTAFDTTINGGSGSLIGTETLLGGVASGTTMDGGAQYISAGTAIGTALLGSATQIVDQNGIARSTTLSGPSAQYVSGGLAIATTVGSGATQNVDDGAIASETTILNGGFQNVAGATAVGSVVDAGGTLDVSYESGVQGVAVGTSDNAQVNNGGLMTVGVDGVSSNTTVMAGGSVVLSSDFLQLGIALGVNTDVMSGGSEYVGRGCLSRHTMIDGGRVEVSSSGQLGGGVVFSGSGGELVIDSQEMPTTTISGFTSGDGIQLAAVTYASSDSVSVNAPNIVTVSAGGAQYNLHIQGAVVGETDFSFGPGSILTKTAAPQMTFLRPPAGSSAGLAGDWNAVAPGAALTAADFAPKIAGGVQSVTSSSHSGVLPSQATPPPPMVIPVSMTQLF